MKYKEGQEVKLHTPERLLNAYGDSMAPGYAAALPTEVRVLLGSVVTIVEEHQGEYTILDQYQNAITITDWMIKGVINTQGPILSKEQISTIKSAHAEIEFKLRDVQERIAKANTALVLLEDDEKRLLKVSRGLCELREEHGML